MAHSSDLCPKRSTFVEISKSIRPAEDIRRRRGRCTFTWHHVMFTAEEESNLQNNLPTRAALACENGRCLNKSWKGCLCVSGSCSESCRAWCSSEVSGTLTWNIRMNSPAYEHATKRLYTDQCSHRTGVCLFTVVAQRRASSTAFP